MKVVAFLPAKGTSERIESKNMKLLNGKPLFLHTLEKLVECDFIDEVYLDSESDEILNYANYSPSFSQIISSFAYGKLSIMLQKAPQSSRSRWLRRWR